MTLSPIPSASVNSLAGRNGRQECLFIRPISNDEYFSRMVLDDIDIIIRDI